MKSHVETNEEYNFAMLKHSLKYLFTKQQHQLPQDDKALKKTKAENETMPISKKLRRVPG